MGLLKLRVSGCKVMLDMRQRIKAGKVGSFTPEKQKVEVEQLEDREVIEDVEEFFEEATRAAREMAQAAAMQQKELFDASELYIGIECGGSDATSGIASNPSVGEMSDLQKATSGLFTWVLK